MKLKQIDGPLPVKVQLAIFKSVRKQFAPESNYPYTGICSALLYISRYTFHYDISCFGVPMQTFPIFTRENAIEHAGANAKGVYWWSRENYESRRIFLDWIITELKKHA